jgi:glycosyltransferase 2 family protein
MNLKKVVSILLITVSVGFLSFNIYKNIGEVKNYHWQFSAINILFIILTAAPIYLVNGLSWHLIVRSIGGKVSFWENFKIWMYSNLGRFIPGGVWQYPMRVVLLAEKKENKALATTAVVLEALFNLIVGAIISIGSLLFFNFKIQQNILLLILGLLICFLGILFIFSSKKLSTICLSIIAKLLNKEIKAVIIDIKFIPIILLTFTLQFILGGALLFFLTNGFVSLNLLRMFEFIGIYASSWLIGYVTIFAPGGLGIQEVSIATLLSSFVPIGLASIIAIMLRILIYISEISNLFILFIFSKINKNH